jgi:hypothetical protein
MNPPPGKRRVDRHGRGQRWGRHVEENTSKVYVGDAGLSAGMVAEPGAGSALFVINLCASIAPVQIDGKQIPGLDNYRLYQVARVEDGRTRHRLRLGFFTSESHAESVLTVVRQQYPTAFTACLCDEDRKFARGYLPNGEGLRNAAAKRPMAVVSAPASAAPAKPQAAASAAAAPQVKPQATSAPAKPAAATSSPVATHATSKAPATTRTASPPAATAAATPAAAATTPTAQPKPAAAKVLAPAAPEVIELTWEPDPSTKSKPQVAPAAAAAVAADAGLDEFTWEPALKLTFSDPPPPASGKKSAEPAQPFHVGRGVQIPDAGISLASEPAAAAAQPVAKATTAAPKTSAPAPSRTVASTAAPATKAAAAQPTSSAPVGAAPSPPVASSPVAKPTPAATKPAPTAQAAALNRTEPVKTAPSSSVTSAAATKAPATSTRAPAASLPELDSTQTIRALTSAELSDDHQEKYFAIQLAASEQPVNLDTMPHLDIFEAYRLYSVATAGSGKIIHSLRLGFFKEAVSAEAVAGYLKTFFGSPTVLRVSVAEHSRFKEPQASKRPIEAKPEAKIVDLNQARATRPVIPTVTMEVPTVNIDPAATGSFKANATGSFKPNASGAFEASATGSYKTLKPAAKSAAPATKRAAPAARGNTGATGKHKALQPKRSLSEELLEEARQVSLSESAIRKLPKNDSLLSRLVGKLTK